MPRGIKKDGTPINPIGTVREEMPKTLWTEDYMTKWDKRQGSLYGKRDKKDNDTEEILDDEKEEAEAGWYALGHFGYYNLAGMFEAMKRDMLVRKIKNAKVIDGIETFNKMWEKNEKDFYKVFGKFDEKIEVPDNIKTKVNKIKDSIKE